MDYPDFAHLGEPPKFDDRHLVEPIPEPPRKVIAVAHATLKLVATSASLWGLLLTDPTSPEVAGLLGMMKKGTGIAKKLSPKEEKEVVTTWQKTEQLVSTASSRIGLALLALRLTDSFKSVAPPLKKIKLALSIVGTVMLLARLIGRGKVDAKAAKGAVKGIELAQSLALPDWTVLGQALTLLSNALTLQKRIKPLL